MTFYVNNLTKVTQFLNVVSTATNSLSASLHMHNVALVFYGSFD